MKYLISGTAGFIGSAVVKHFLSKGEQVRSIPRDMLYDRWDLQKYIESEQPDYIIHFAAYGNHSTQTELGSIVEANIHCTLNLLEASKNVPYKGFINTSTSSVLLPKQTYYSASKMATEYFAKCYQRVVSVRPFSIYGPGEAEHRFIPTVIKNINQGTAFNLDPSPAHDWTSIWDFISGLETVMSNIDNLQGQSVNIGTGKDYTNKAIVEFIESISGKKAVYNTLTNMRSYDSHNWVADNTVLRELGWKPEYSLKQGLEKTYNDLTVK